MRGIKLLPLLGALLVVVAPCFSQEVRGTIQGRVMDASGAVIPGAAITATNTATNVASKSTTNDEGAYNLLFLTPGTYTVTASAKGFKTVRRESVQLQIHERLQVDLTLEVGAITEEIQVTAESPLLQTASSNIGQVVGSRMISDLPNPHGSAFSFVYLTPGVTTAYPGGLNFQQPMHMQTVLTMANVNGAPMGTTDFTLDGVPNTQNSMADRGSGISNSPPADMVEEFKIETAFDASVGRTSGAVVNFTLKSGANKPHGTAFYFHRDPEWTANQFFANRAGQARGDFTYDRWGGTFNGPIEIPKLIKGRDRTFFSYGYEQLHQKEQSAGITTTVPTAAQLNGDFSALLALGSQYQIYDPATIQPAPNGRFSRQPLSGNKIPASRISAIGKTLASYWPAPNNTARTDGCS